MLLLTLLPIYYMFSLKLRIIILTKYINTPEVLIEYLFEFLSQIYNEKKDRNFSTNFYFI